MKRKLAAILLVSLLLMSVQVASAKKYSLTFHTGAVGGLYMEPAAIWADQWHKNLPDVEASVILGGGFTNPLVVAESPPNEAVGITDTLSAREVQLGVGEYAGRVPQGIKNLRALWRFNVKSWGHILARPGVVPEGIETFGEFLATKPNIKLALKIRGSADEIFARRLLECYGLTYDDINSWGGSVSFNNPADISGLMIDGHADVTIAIVRVPASYVLDMDASIKGMKWLALEPETIDRLVEEYGYIRGYHPGADYTTLGKDIPSVAFDHLVFVHEDMDEELAYQLTKVVISDPERVGKAVPALSTFSAAEAPLDTGFPLHPGAERAYRELGLLK